MNIRYIVDLSEEQRTQLHELTGGGQARVRRVKRAQILLAAEHGHGDAAVASLVGVGTSTVYRTKRRFGARRSALLTKVEPTASNHFAQIVPIAVPLPRRSP